MKRFFLITLLSLFVVGSVLANSLPIFGVVPYFSFQNEKGTQFSSNQLHKKIWIADFIYTRCTEECPRITGRMAALQQMVRANPEIRLVSFSVDPKHDTPEVLLRYAKLYKADLNQWIFLTGDKRAILNLMKKGFHLAFREEPIVHANTFVLVDGRWGIRGYYDALKSESLNQILRDISLLRIK